MKFVCTIFVTLFVYILNAQPYDPEKVNPKAASLHSQGLQEATDGNLKTGIRLLQQAVKIDKRFEDAYLSIAGMYGELKNYDSAVINYETARNIDSAYFKDYNLPYSINLAGKGLFEKALQAVEQFTTISNLNEGSMKAAAYRTHCYQFAIDFK